MGVVYKGLDPVINRNVAIKTLAPQGASPQSAELLDRFKQEAQAAGRLNHPNIVSVYEYGEDGDFTYIAMEFVDGYTLSERTGCSTPLELGEIYDLMLKVLDALAYAHDHGVVHRDIKPSNIMRTDTGEVKITDFGIARIESSELTQFGTVLGTPGYMSPEQLLGQQVDHRSDIFSCGVLFYELLTGERAFQSTNFNSTVYKVVNMELPPASKLCPNLPRAVDPILEKALSKSPDDRFADAGSFARAIEAHLLGKVPEGVTTAAPAPDLERTVIQPRERIPASRTSDPDLTIQTGGAGGSPAAGQRPGWLIPVFTGAGIAALVAIVSVVYLLKPFGYNFGRTETTPAPTAPDTPQPDAKESPSMPQEKRLVVTPDFRPGTALQDCDACPELVVVPPGGFLQGSPDTESGRERNEGPQHRVEIGYPLAVGKHEVTRGEFAQFVSDTGHESSGCWAYDGDWTMHSDRSWQSPGFDQDDSHPVTCISWSDAIAYADWLSGKTGNKYRLMSSSEWEYVARAGLKQANDWAENPATSCRSANVADRSAESRYPGWTVHDCKDGFIHTAPAGSFGPNGFGVHGMLGNVFEWVEDCWNRDYTDAPVDGSAWAQGDCSQRLLRGGSWFSMPQYVRYAYRNHLERDYRASTFGFRIVRALDSG